MAFWCRIKQKKLVSLANQFKRCYFHIPGPCLVNPIALNTRTCALEKPTSVIWNAQIDFACNARFFAAPVQAKPKREEKDTSGPRLNEKITAESVRLVTEEGHLVVSRREALERARRLDVDLVEVQRNANPPVCKLMNYHKEKYKKQVKEKDRSKSKSEVTLRKGGCKEVRFSGKTEQKDLQMKADMVKRLMERGYRVKCMAMGTEDQDLGGLLSRLSVLIEDVSIVESGPRVEKKQAYVVVRHVKFGPSKKGPGKKASKVVGSMSSEVQTIASLLPTMNPSMLNGSPTQFEETVDLESGEDETLSDEEDTLVEDIDRNKPTWSVFDANDDSDYVFDFGDEAKVEPQKLSSATNNFPDFMSPGPLVDSTRAETVLSSSPESLPGTENGYKMGPVYKDPPARSMDGKDTSARHTTRSEPQFPKQDRQLQLDLNGPPSTRETKHMENPSSSASSYGIFGAPKVNDTPEKNGLLADNRYKKGNSIDSTRQPRPRGVSAYPNSHSSNTDRGGRPGIDNGGQGKWGIFSGESSNVMPSRNSESRAKSQR